MTDSFTISEQAAFTAGFETARQMALAAAVTTETRDDAREVRQQTAIAALYGLAAGLHAAFIAPPTETDPLRRIMATIAADPAKSGTVACPTWQGLVGLGSGKQQRPPSRPVRDDRMPPVDAVGQSCC
ncbi:hypothetical protein MKK69_22080 [Methylobacterium sp. J-026]|uniref:hypothetical protein n=1 Tax=Methylobacterium sp. J-026 TaxID=2836624 RepID=UPI001FBBD1F8|nr:hypothetical protein [Methylobacterium sp. J-026]MCJ2136704.1 hypothetical protein [Methylobacterium sp. J-026]